MVQVLRQKQIVLVPFPFTNQTDVKRRPALVLSTDSFNQNSSDIVVCAITSNLEGDYSVRINQEDWKDGLYSESCVKFANILTIDKNLVIKPIGRLNNERFRDVLLKIYEVVK